MPELTSDVIDMKLSDSGDLIFTPVGDPIGDIETTENNPVLNISQSIYNRIIESEEEWGNESSDLVKVDLLTLARDSSEPFMKPCADLDRFVGEPLNETTLAAIQDSIVSAFAIDNVFASVDIKVLVNRITESTINVTVVARVDYEWFVTAIASRDDAESLSVRNSLKPLKDYILIITMNYNTSNGDFSISNLDIKEHIGIEDDD